MGHHRHRQARQAEDSGQYSEFRFHGRTSRRFTERPQFLSFLWSGFCLLPTLIGRREACSAAVLIVLKADELEHLEARAEKLERKRVLERLGKCPRGGQGKDEEERFGNWAACIVRSCASAPYAGCPCHRAKICRCSQSYRRRGCRRPTTRWSAQTMWGRDHCRPGA